MSIYSRPIMFAILSVAVILAGTLVTTIIPLFMPSTQPSEDYIKPYSAIELEGRDIYIREGCNNCHTQTVRPLRTEVARYGEYSKPEEFAYDRPHLWGSRRTGPDLNRVGAKYPDAWHYKHTVNPQSMFEKSNMPPYKWLAKAKLNTSHIGRKVTVLKLGYTEADAKRQLSEYKATVTSGDYSSRAVRDEVTPEHLRAELTELDALIAYLQYLGRDVKALVRKTSITVAEPSDAAESESVEKGAEGGNPLAGDREAILLGKKAFMSNCSACHGKDAKGGIGLNLTDAEWKYGGTDRDIYTTISGGRPGGMPPFGALFQEKDIWRIIAYLRTVGVKQP